MPITDMDLPLAKMPVKFMLADDDLDQLLTYGSIAAGDSGLEPFDGLWSTSISLVDFSYPGSIDLYLMRILIESPGDTVAVTL